MFYRIFISDDSIKLLSFYQTSLTVLRELAVLEARHYKLNPNRDPLLSIHRKEGDSEYMIIVANEVGPEVSKFIQSVNF